MKPFRPDNSFHRYKGNLPHWNQEEVTYFVTFRLRDSIPESAMTDWKHRRNEWIRRHGFDPSTFSSDLLKYKDKKAFNQTFGKRFQELLDAGHGSCLLKKPANIKIVADAFQFFHEKRYQLGSLVIMPNHVHLLITPIGENSLPKIMQSLKSFTAKEINKNENKSGALWQRESYDHIIRSERQLEHYQNYIQENPLKAKLRTGEYFLKM